MKKIFIGLLLAAAAGTGIYFLFFRKEKEPTVKDNKELIIGKWKTRSYEPVFDSLQPFYTYDFRQEGKLLRNVTDSVKTDTLYYEWNKTGELMMKTNQADSLAEAYAISKLVADTLQLKKTGKPYTINLQKVK